MARKKQESPSNRVDQSVGDLDVSALCGDEVPDVVKVTDGLRCEPMCHTSFGNEIPVSARRLSAVLVGREAGASALLHLGGDLAHRLIGDGVTFAACE